MTNKILVGSLEQCNLPGLGITELHVRVDTGAATSSLHVDNIEEFELDGESWIRFDIHPDIHDVQKLRRCEAKVSSRRKVKSSTATKQRRYVIETMIEMAEQHWPIQLTLTDRSEMTYLMLLGREAMAGKFIVDPSLEYLLNSQAE
ncbi:ATP-dependent zinc protease [Glaciecola sp. MH2013]|uniref:ATP-dependent zinc protease family protein n=1 Tax=Glaciecola sp. MH2013 TaxID=2785524 RepID=UPI00189FD8AD|nr:ATP-dependent zinc protease [Glaciecola sp. MH2013]MBF7073509.1 ATP-dependent zinc protease [Glaciecola sp. MH2013]